MDSKNIIEIISKHVKVDPEKLDFSLRFKEDLHLDSIDLFQIIMEIEETCKIKIKDSDLLDIHTVKDAIDKINNAKP